MKTIVVDCETNSGAVDGKLTNVWCIGMYCIEEDKDIVDTEEDWKDNPNYYGVEVLAPILNDPDNVIVFHNAVFDVWVIESYFGIKLKQWQDTMLLSYSVNPMASHSLASWGEKLGSPKLDFTNYDGGYTPEMREYLIQDCRLTAKVWEYLSQYLDDVPSYFRIDLPFERIIIEMQTRGVKIDMTKFVDIIQSVKAELAPIKEEIERLAPLAPGKKTNTKSLRKQYIKWEDLEVNTLQEGLYALENDNGIEEDPKRYTWRKIEKYNPNSAEQTSWLLTKLYGWEPKRFSEKTKKAAVDKAVLAELDYPLAQVLVDYSELNKLVTTYGDSLREKVDPKNNRVYTNYNNCVTLTGRLSSSSPNLQNIPNKGERGEQIRSLFVAKDGYKLIGVDIDQFQMRILAWYLMYYLEDEEEFPNSYSLWEDFMLSENPDPHAVTARLIFGEEFTTEQRKQAKTINFGVLFGIGVSKLARQLGLSIPEAERLLGAVSDKVPELDLLRQLVWYQCRQNEGVIYTLFGRRGYYPNISSEDSNLRSRAERQCFNFLIQGTEADIVKMMMLRTKQFMKQAHLNGYFVMQVHDEYLLEVPYFETTETADIVNHVINDLEWLPHLKLTGSAVIGDSWAECH